MRFDDKETRSHRRFLDMFAPFWDVWDAFVSNVGKHYAPGPLLTVDEQLVPFRGRCSCLQYLPSKQTHSQRLRISNKLPRQKAWVSEPPALNESEHFSQSTVKVKPRSNSDQKKWTADTRKQRINVKRVYRLKWKLLWRRNEARQSSLSRIPLT